MVGFLLAAILTSGPATVDAGCIAIPLNDDYCIWDPDNYLLDCHGNSSWWVVCDGGSPPGGAPPPGGGGVPAGDGQSPGDNPDDTAEERARQNWRCQQDNSDCGSSWTHIMPCCFANTRFGDQCDTCDCGRCCIDVFGVSSSTLSITLGCQTDCQIGFSGGGARGQDNPKDCENIWV